MRTKLHQYGRLNKIGFPQRPPTFHDGIPQLATTFGVVLSVVVIAKNEARNLPRCLNSVRGLADDVVVVDSGSTDGTSELAEAQGARVFQREFISYADQKNWAAEQATQSYVLSLDADEALSQGLRDELREWKTQLSGATSTRESAKAWSMPRLTHYCGTWIRHGGWYPDRKVRLWLQGSGRWMTASEGAMLHEAWVPNPGVVVGSLGHDLLHYSYYTTADHHRQWSKFATLGADDARALGRTSNALKPWFRGAFQGFKQALVQGGWRDGRAGWEVARWSACAAFWKWKRVAASGALSNLRRVAVVRTDALGDNVVTLPLAGALKDALPGVEVVWICKPYAEAIVRQSKHVDEVRLWSGTENVMSGLDAVVFAYPEPELLRASAIAGVPVRVATGRRWASFRWANRRMWRSRRSRPEHETQQGLRLLHGLALPARWRFPEREDWFALTGLPVRAQDSQRSRPEFRDAVVLHPGNHGSANGWSIDRFEELAERLISRGTRVVVTGTASERPALQPWLERAKRHDLFEDSVGAWSLAELSSVLGQVKCVVASSTGPLHLASALGSPSVGLYRSDAPFWPERWAPLGPGCVLSTSRVCAQGGLDLPVEEVLVAVQEVCSGGGYSA
jgi:ADP-heptose:LPS heptosyltransferase/glycosyltransferase involved in cell wall biosynthesis